jgi:hypothetical protein
MLPPPPPPPTHTQDALEYGLIDEVIQPDAGKAAAAASYWLRSGRAESDGRLEQWKEYLELQEEYTLKDAVRKVGGWGGGGGQGGGGAAGEGHSTAERQRPRGLSGSGSWGFGRVVHSLVCKPPLLRSGLLAVASPSYLQR